MNNIYLTINYDLIERQKHIAPLIEYVDSIVDDNKNNAKVLYDAHLVILQESYIEYINAKTPYDKNYALAENVLAACKIDMLKMFIEDQIDKTLAKNAWLELCDLDIELYTHIICHDFDKANAILQTLIALLKNDIQ